MASGDLDGFHGVRRLKTRQASQRGGPAGQGEFRMAWPRADFLFASGIPKWTSDFGRGKLRIHFTILPVTQSEAKVKYTFYNWLPNSNHVGRIPDQTEILHIWACLVWRHPFWGWEAKGKPVMGCPEEFSELELDEGPMLQLAKRMGRGHDFRGKTVVILLNPGMWVRCF